MHLSKIPGKLSGVTAAAGSVLGNILSYHRIQSWFIYISIFYQYVKTWQDLICNVFIQFCNILNISVVMAVYFGWNNAILMSRWKLCIWWYSALSNFVLINEIQSSSQFYGSQNKKNTENIKETHRCLFSRQDTSFNLDISLSSRCIPNTEFMMFRCLHILAAVQRMT